MSEVRSTFDSKKARTRARVSNGAILPDVDGRSAAARRFRDIIEAIVADQGGADRMSEARRQLVRRFAAAAVLAEQLESKLANGQAIDLQEHALLCSSLVRLSARIGINRIPRNVTPSLSEYVSSLDLAPETEDAA